MPKRPARQAPRRRRRGRPARPRQLPGTPPGAFDLPPGTPPPVLWAFSYTADVCEELKPQSVAEVAGLIQPGRRLWLNVDGFGDAATLAGLGELFGLHHLALEDVVNLGQRAKVEDYGSYLFVIARLPAGAGGGNGTTEQLSLFLTDAAVITFQERAGDCFDPVRERLRRGGGRLRAAGPDYLAYALLDAAIDAYFPTLDAMSDHIEALEEEIFERTAHDTLPRLHDVRHELRDLRRAITPHRDALTSLLRDVTPLVSEETRVYLRDCFDHAVRLIELVEVLREACGDLMSAHLTTVSNRMNEVMKVLTIISTIFIPLSFLAGIWGMNFDPDASRWSMPELRWAMGYPLALGVMAASAGAMLVYFWRRGWFE